MNDDDEKVASHEVDPGVIRQQILHSLIYYVVNNNAWSSSFESATSRSLNALPNREMKDDSILFSLLAAPCQCRLQIEALPVDSLPTVPVDLYVPVRVRFVIIKLYYNALFKTTKSNR